MEVIPELIKRVKARNDGLSDDKIADELGTFRSAVVAWKGERRYPTQEQLLGLCELAGEDPAYWHFMMESRRARTKKTSLKMEQAAQRYTNENSALRNKSDPVSMPQ